MYYRYLVLTVLFGPFIEKNKKSNNNNNYNFPRTY